MQGADESSSDGIIVSGRSPTSVDSSGATARDNDDGSTVVNSSQATAGDDTYCDDSSKTPEYTPEGIRKSSREAGLRFACFKGRQQAAIDNQAAGDNEGDS